MNDESQERGESQRPEALRPYVPPVLNELGNVQDLTRGAGNAAGDNAGVSDG